MTSEADWMSRSVVDDMREEARSARQVDTRAVHAPACHCRDCLRDAYVPGDDRGDSAVVVLWALASCALVFLLLLLFVGQPLMCSAYDDALRYCPGHTDSQEIS